MERPKFEMPACSRHFFKANRWWCRRCHREVEGQFREVCESWWASQLRARG